MGSFNEYLKALKTKNFTYISMVELLDESETISKTIWLDVDESSGSIKNILNNGIRRTCNIVLDNSKRQYDIDINKIWLYQKLRLFVGIQYINSQGLPDTYLISQGVYYITNPQDAYNPTSKTISFECIDKWGRLDGKIGGNLDGTYSFPKNYKDASGNEITQDYNMYDIIRNILRIPIRSDFRNIAFVDKVINSVSPSAEINTFLTNNGFDIYNININESVIDVKNNIIYYRNNAKVVNVAPTWAKYNVSKNEVIDYIQPLLSNFYLVISDVYGISKIFLPYSLTKGLGNTYSDIILEIAKILAANVYYDRTGRFVLHPTNEESGYLKDVDKEIAWEFTENDSMLYDLSSETYDFENVYNQVIAQGTIAGEGTVTVAVQNNDIKSPTSVGRIGVKSTSFTNLPTYSYKLFMEKNSVDEATAKKICEDSLRDYAIYLLKKNTVVQTKLSIKCSQIPHLEVDQVITITKKDGKTKKYLINSIDLPLNPSEPMTIELVSIFDLDTIKIVK